MKASLEETIDAMIDMGSWTADFTRNPFLAAYAHFSAGIGSTSRSD